MKKLSSKLTIVILSATTLFSCQKESFTRSSVDGALVPHNAILTYLPNKLAPGANAGACLPTVTVNALSGPSPAPAPLGYYFTNHSVSTSPFTLNNTTGAISWPNLAVGKYTCASTIYGIYYSSTPPADSGFTSNATFNLTVTGITPFAGTGVAGNTGNGAAATAAEINVTAIAYVKPLLDLTDEVYFCDAANDVVRRVGIYGGTITTVAGSNGIPGSTPDNIAASSSLLSHPSAIATDNIGNVYIADNGNYKIKKITGGNGVIPGGIISTIAGNGVDANFTAAAGSIATADAIGPVSSIAVDPNGTNLYMIVQTSNLFVKATKIIAVNTTTDRVSILATPAGYSPYANLTIDQAGNLYYQIATSTGAASAAIYKFAITNPGVVTEIVGGSGTAGYSGDGATAVNAKISTSISFNLDPSGNMYITDATYHVVREISAATKIITTIAGKSTATTTGGDGGTAAAATFAGPSGITTFDGSILYVVDGARIRAIYQ
jgi:hypothetical protein